MLIRNLLNEKGREILDIGPEQTVYEAVEKMAEHHIGALLVRENEELRGIITERDYLDKIILKGRTSKTTKVNVIMTSEINTVSPTDTVERCMEMMTEGSFRHLPVMKEKRVVGVVSIGDLVKAVISKQKREINSLRDYIGGPHPH